MARTEKNKAFDPEPFDPEQLDVVVFAINYFGKGSHPVAREETLPYFVERYVLQCLKRMKDEPNVSGDAKGFADEVLSVIEPA